MTYEDSEEWLTHSAADWVRSGVSVVARDPDTGEIIGMLLSTILTREQPKTYKLTNTSLNPKVCSQAGKEQLLFTSCVASGTDFTLWSCML